MEPLSIKFCSQICESLSFLHKIASTITIMGVHYLFIYFVDSNLEDKRFWSIWFIHRRVYNLHYPSSLPCRSDRHLERGILQAVLNCSCCSCNWYSTHIHTHTHTHTHTRKLALKIPLINSREL